MSWLKKIFGSDNKSENSVASSGVEKWRSAIEGNRVDDVRRLLAGSMDPNDIKIDGHTLLYKASYLGHPKVVELLLEAGADVDHVDNDGCSALTGASIEGHHEVVKLLLEEGVETDVAGPAELTALTLAAQNGHVKVVKLLLETGANITAVREDLPTPLYMASMRGHAEVVNLLLAAGAFADPSDKNMYNNKYYVLGVAGDNGHPVVVKLLLEANVTADISSSMMDGLVESASKKGHTEVVKLLKAAEEIAITAQATQISTPPRSPIKKTAETMEKSRSTFEKNRVDYVRRLLAGSMDPDSIRIDRRTLLYDASELGLSKVVELLLKAGANVNHVDDFGGSALMGASKEGHWEVVELLLKAGANVNHHVGKYEISALYLASNEGHWEVVKLLLEAGTHAFIAIGISSTLTEAASALSGASKNGHVEVVKVFLEAGAIANLSSSDKDFVLHCAVEGGHPAVVKLLIEARITTELSSYRFEGFVKRASKKGYLEVVKLLESAEEIANAARVAPASTPQLRRPVTTKTKEVVEGHWSVVDIRRMLAKGVDPNTIRNNSTALDWAARGGYVETARLLLQAGATIGISLFAAAALGHVEIAKLLLEAGADVNAKFGEEDALYAASSIGNVELVKLLLQAGADIHATSIQEAAKNGHGEIVELLEAAGRMSTPPSLSSTTESTPVNVDESVATDSAFMAFFKADLGHVIRELLTSQGFRLTEKGYLDVIISLANMIQTQLIKQQRFADLELHIIDVTKRQAMVDLLVKALKAKPAETYLMVIQAATTAAEIIHVPNNDAVINSTLPQETTPSQSSPIAPVPPMSADIKRTVTVEDWRSGNYYAGAFADVVRGLLASGMDPNAVDKKNGESALYTASRIGCVETIKLLLEAGANVNATREDGTNALQTASGGGCVDIVILLLAAGANVNAIDKYGVAALCSASSNGHAEVVKLLLQAGADISITGHFTPLICAAENGHVEVIKLLIATGADVNIYCDYSPLIMAAIEGHMEVVKLLLKAGADVNTTSCIRKTALQHATEKGHTEIIKLLETAGRISTAPPPPDTLENLRQAEVLIAQGEDLLSQERYEEATQVFAASIKLLNDGNNNDPVSAPPTLSPVLEIQAGTKILVQCGDWATITNVTEDRVYLDGWYTKDGKVSSAAGTPPIAMAQKWVDQGVWTLVSTDRANQQKCVTQYSDYSAPNGLKPPKRTLTASELAEILYFEDAANRDKAYQFLTNTEEYEKRLRHYERRHRDKRAMYVDWIVIAPPMALERCGFYELLVRAGCRYRESDTVKYLVIDNDSSDID